VNLLLKASLRKKGPTWLRALGRRGEVRAIMSLQHTPVNMKVDESFPGEIETLRNPWDLTNFTISKD
jgi:hypothetical protein